MIDFPNTPTIGQIFTTGGLSWTWDGSKWNMSATAGGPYVPLSGGTMTGPLVLSQDPVAPLGAATKNYVDDAVAGDNRIINGDMRIDQRNNGASGTASVYTVDRWFCGQTVPGKLQWGRAATAGPVLLALGFPYFLVLQTVSAYNAAAGETYNLQQRFEADMISDFAWGTPGAQPVTLSFWANSTIAGTHSGAIRNDLGTRTYPFTFSLPAANTWTKIVLTIPGDTGTPWVMSGNGQGAHLVFDFGSGSNLIAPVAGVWSSNNYTGVTGAQRIVTTPSATFNITGVKLEIGSVATPFNRQSTAKSMADCQRYYQIGSGGMTANGNTGNSQQVIGNLAVWMRATPTFTTSNVNQSGCTGTAAGPWGGNWGYSIAANVSATGTVGMNCSFQATAEL